MMDLRERVLFALSRPVSSPDNATEPVEVTIGNSLDLLESEFAGLGDLVSGKRVVDFGSGLGLQSIALVRKYGCSVVGIDTNAEILASSIANAEIEGIPTSQLRFVGGITDDMVGNFDFVISQNSFEHFGDPEGVLAAMRRLIGQQGRLLISFGPPWLAPYGSHMHFFCRIPWINVLFPEHVVMNVRNRYRNDGATRYEDVESGLNRMTVARFESIVRSSGLEIEFRNYRCVKRINSFGRLPGVREFLINHISVILAPASLKSMTMEQPRAPGPAAPCG